jgi:SpoVK/Ycf46/Vps4 family AAA+-type ATPase
VLEALARDSGIILWIDEAGQQFAGLGGEGAPDSAGETANRIFAALLTWMQERRDPVLMYLSANRIDHLPPQLFRRGRIDRVFLFDLPNALARAELWQIHLGAVGQARLVETLLPVLVQHSCGYVGAEIEGAIQDALVRALADDVADGGALDSTNPIALTGAHLLGALRSMMPVSRTRRAEIDAMRRLAITVGAQDAASGPRVWLDADGNATDGPPATGAARSGDERRN